MATTPVRHRDTSDINSADDMRRLGPVGMMVGAVIAVLAIMAIVYAPRMWGIDRYGSDVAAAPAQQSATSPGH